jgi:hypothetical protein
MTGLTGKTAPDNRIWKAKPNLESRVHYFAIRFAIFGRRPTSGTKCPVRRILEGGMTVPFAQINLATDETRIKHGHWELHRFRVQSVFLPWPLISRFVIRAYPRYPRFSFFYSTGTSCTASRMT